MLIEPNPSFEVNSCQPLRSSPEDSIRAVAVAAGWSRTRHGAFTLVEMLVVLGVIALLLGLIVPALGPLKGSQDVTTAAYNLAGSLETARNYAISNNTYTWIGFYEQDYANTSPPTASLQPPYKGVGHLVAAIVYSKDGTKLVDDTVTASTPLPAGSLAPVGKLLHVYAVHLKALDAPPQQTANSPDPAVASLLKGRPYQTDIDSATLEQSLFNSESPDTTLRPFTALGYTFYKTIRFNPRGEANINSTLPCTRIIEFGLQPTHGNAVAAVAPGSNDPPNSVAVQQAGIGGAVNIYRQ